MNCKHCGQLMDDGITRCPKCGQETKKPINSTKLAAIVVTAILVACAVAGIVWALSRPAQNADISPSTDPTNDTTISDPADATGATEPTEYVLTDEDLANHPVLSRDSYTGEEGDTSAMGEIIATIGDNTLSNSQFAIWYWQTYYDMVNQLGSYAAIYGLDTTTPLDEQECTMSEIPMTWEQFFIEQALNNWHSYLSLYLEAKSSGMTLSEENQAELDSIETEINTAAQNYGFADATAMLESDYGKGVTVDDYKYFLEILLLGNQYYTEHTEAIALTDEEVDAFYQEHLTDYIAGGILQDNTPATINVRHILITPENILDSEDPDTTEATESTDATEETLSDEELIELCRAKAQTILDQWKAGESTEESFGALATQYTDDPGSESTGGLYEGVAPGQMITEFNDWCFDPDRKPGDTDLVETSYGIHIMYFVSASETKYWYSCASADLTTERMNNLITDTMAKYTLDADYTKLWLAPLVAATVS